MPENITIFDPISSKTKDVRTLKSPDGSVIIVCGITRERIGRITKGEPQIIKDGTERLYALAEIIMAGGTDIFTCLPKTKTGTIPKNQTILVADTSYKCTNGAAYDNYITSRRIQMRLKPVYANRKDYMNGKAVSNIRELCIGWEDSAKKREPIFDRDGHILKIKTEKPVYLKNDQIQQGVLYEEPSGTQYLCLTGANVTEKSKSTRPDGSTWEGSLYDLHRYSENVYLKWSAAMEKRLGDDASLENILRDIIARKHNLEGLSRRNNPRKFVKQVRRIYDPADTKEAVITDIRPGYNGEVWTDTYHIKEN